MAIPGATRGGLTQTEWNRATAGVGGFSSPGQSTGPTYLGGASYGSSSSSGGGSSGCQASRVSPFAGFDFGAALKRLVNFFSDAPVSSLRPNKFRD